jgi:uncharacterized protein (DUF362 family)
VGIIAVSENPLLFDECIANLMGVHIKKIPTLVGSRKARKYSIAECDEKGIITLK